eukprot:scaffold34915_cov180-Amphora_coffeaeformis.AAC.17
MDAAIDSTDLLRLRNSHPATKKTNDDLIMRDDDDFRPRVRPRNNAQRKIWGWVLLLVVGTVALLAYSDGSIRFLQYQQPFIDLALQEQQVIQQEETREVEKAFQSSSSSAAAAAAAAAAGALPLPCSDESLYADPDSFADCTAPSPIRPVCDPEQHRQWEEAVRLRYDKLAEQGVVCISNTTIKGKFGPSGPGSSLVATATVRETLETQVFSELGIRTMLDCPCGDWFWMQTVDLSSVKYFGGDITNVTVERNNQCFATSSVLSENNDNTNIKRNYVRFHHFDWTCQVPPPVDLLLVRDVLFHLSEETVMNVLYNINQSGAKYLATTTFTKGKGVWRNHLAYPELREQRLKDGNGMIGFQRINLFGPPYNFLKPLYVAQEEEDRIVGVWKLPLDHVGFPSKYYEADGIARERR